ncbi:MAG: hypothetical protein AMJ65_06855 [Phycisphaerae bacterium SG8_4]|nr:MAG: hypothetical protein AMJ65_06855 [Phycisphaerae bacterium SG8_4]
MAAEGWRQLWSYTAEATLPAQYEIVEKGTGNNQVTQAGADAGFGVCVNAPAAAGDPVDVVVFGITKVKAGAAIATGVRFTSDSAGRAVAANALNEEIVGVTLTGAANANELVTVVVCGVGLHGGAT